MVKDDKKSIMNTIIMQKRLWMPVTAKEELGELRYHQKIVEKNVPLTGGFLI